LPQFEPDRFVAVRFAVEGATFRQRGTMMELSAIGRVRSLGTALALLFLVSPTFSHAEEDALKGVALVIGESKYEHIPALANPANDAREMVSLLSDLGFDARSVSDRDAKKLKRDLERFVEDAEGADVAFLYYSGHGIESGGENWLVPVDADVSSLNNAEDALVPLSSVLDELKSVVPVTIVLLDACRTNPFPADVLVKKSPDNPGVPIGAGGLTPVRGAAALSGNEEAADNLGTVIGFAAEPGRPALDGTAGENSPYAAALLRHLGAMDGNEFGMVMRMVTEEVYLDTGTRQRPWVNESLRRLLYFGVSQPAPTGEDGLITGERRQLLLTISELPDFNRAQVETVAAKDGVPLDALYGVLRALGTEKIPEDPTELEKLLDAQADQLKALIASRDALRTDDPEIRRLTEAADRAINEGAIVTARTFLDDAVKRVEATRSDVDAAEEAVKQKRLADAAVYARRAKASSLAFDYLAAAADYRKAFELVDRWDDGLRLRYKSGEGQLLAAHGEATGDRAVLDQALAAYREALGFSDENSLDWAITNNDTATVLQVMGERMSDTAALEEATAMLESSLAVFEREKDDALWAKAKSNIGNVLMMLGERESDSGKLEDSVAAFRSVLEKRDRAKAALDWAGTQNNIGIALYELALRETGTERLLESKAAYRLALEEYTREKSPAEWAMVQNNLGNTLSALAAARNDVALYNEAAASYRASLQVRTREQLPMLWAMSQLNLAGALDNIAKYEQGTEHLPEAEAALREILGVYKRDVVPLDWANTQSHLGSVLQLLGQRSFDISKFEESADAYRAALEEYTEADLPLDYADTNFNLGTSLRLAGSFKQDEGLLRQSVEAYENALKYHTRETHPRQWALDQSYRGSTLQSLATVGDDPIAAWEKAVLAQRAALEVLTRENTPLDWANAQNWMGECLLNLGTFGKKPALLMEAKSAFEAAKEVMTREVLPMQWAIVENSIGDVHANLAYLGGDPTNFARAIEKFESAKQIYMEWGYAPMVTLIDKKIELLKQAKGKL
jgi:uncharacterized caspase-like protein